MLPISQTSEFSCILFSQVANLACSMSNNEDGVKMVRYAASSIASLYTQVINAARILAARPRSKVSAHGRFFCGKVSAKRNYVCNSVQTNSLRRGKLGCAQTWSTCPRSISIDETEWTLQSTSIDSFILSRLAEKSAPVHGIHFYHYLLFTNIFFCFQHPKQQDNWKCN